MARVNLPTGKDNNLQYASTMIRTGAILLDVRTRREFCEAHLCGAWHVNTKLPPLDSEACQRLYRKLQEKVEPYPEATPIILYCKKGIRAKMAKDILETMGYRNVASLGGVEIEPLQSVMSGKTKLKGLNVCLCKK
jgi:rhodanese-related sulfurtransferase